MDALLQDLRYAFRTIAAHPGFALLSILCLAIGIGINSTIFSVVDTVAIRPLPFTDPDALVVLRGTQASTGIDEAGISWLDLQDYRAQTQAFSEIAANSNRSMTLTDRGEPERLLGSLVTSNLFPMLGIDPILGRHIRPDEDQPGAARVALLSHNVWLRRFAGDPGIVGRSITLDGLPHTVVGVMPPRFQFPEQAQLWTALGPVHHATKREDRFLHVIARLAAGSSLDRARADVAAVAARLASAYRTHDGWSATAITMRDEMMPDDVRLIVFTMMGAVTLVLIIACANVANLLLARATVRQREISVRAALGAGRLRIARQLLTESVLIALASVPLGAAVASIGLQWLTASIPPQDQVPYYIDWSMNWRVVAYACAVAVATGLVFGLVPALHAIGPDLHRSLKDGGRGAGAHASRNRLRNALVVGEIALSLVLLVGASLFMRSFLKLQQADLGLDMAPLMTARFVMDESQYPSPEAMTRRTEDIVRRVEDLPGVAAAYASNFVPIEGGGGAGRIVPDGMPVEAGREPQIFYAGVTPHVLETLGLPLVAGRDFADNEGSTRSGVAIVNADLAERAWPGRRDVVGLRFRLVDDPAAQWITVIGMTTNFSPWDVGDDRQPQPFAFLPYPYMSARNTGVTVRVAGGAPASITAALRSEIRNSDPLLPVFSERTGEEIRQTAFWDARLFGFMFSIFGAVALLLASIGVYGVLSYAVAQRTQEIGVRMALGASRRDVLALVLGQGARLAAIGIVAGVAGAALVTRVIRSQLYNVSATDPLSFTGTALVLALVAVTASYVPARRATVVDPLIALRTE
jgi:predicted permease